MNKERFFERTVLNFCLSTMSTIGFVASNVPTVKKTIPQPLWILIVIATVVATLTSGILLTFHAGKERNRKFHSEKGGKLSKFFQEWYEKPGRHKIFCSDLRWLEPRGMESALRALCDLKDRVDIYLVDDTGDVVKRLRDSGARVHTIPSEYMADCAPRMSLLEDEGTTAAAIRFKKDASDAVEIRISSERTVVSLAHAYAKISAFAERSETASSMVI